MTKKQGANGIRKAIEDAAPVPPPAAVPDHLASRFKMLEGGLYRKIDDGLQWISAPFRIEAETLDDDGRWGMLLSWKDRNGARREEVFARELFAGECGELRSRLASGGLTMLADQRSRQAFAEYLNIAETPARARCVSRTGWHRIGAARAFVLPDNVLGDAGARVILQATARERAPFNVSGTLSDWRGAVAALTVSNSRLVFSISCAFAGPLLDLTGEDGGGFNLKGQSRVGKTTALRVAASVWGGEPGIGAAAYIRAWRATGNALEGIASMHSDTLLCLDEMGQVDAKELGEISYMLANGQGKTRADRGGAIRQQSRFRVLFISTGEVGLADKNAEGKKTTKAGQEVRFVDIAADAGVGLGIFETLHQSDNAAEFAEELRQGTRQAFGTAGPAFVASLLAGMKADPEFIMRLAERVDEVIFGWLTPYPDATGQVRSVAKRFAMVAVAGELATEADLTGWPPGEAVESCGRLFRSWLSSRGTAGAREDAQAVNQLREFLTRHGDSRFQDWRKEELVQDNGDLKEAPPHERFRTVNRAGWRRWIVDSLGRGSWVYYLTREGMIEALSGLDFRAAIKALVERGFIVRDSAGKSTVSRRPPGVEDNIRL
ncbi:MAG TPA: DUF927 domain-containing protein, partial [Acidocella sp.]|nr:DUF927 domain-containing protein [Acidocella sp.]